MTGKEKEIRWNGTILGLSAAMCLCWGYWWFPACIMAAVLSFMFGIHVQLAYEIHVLNKAGKCIANGKLVDQWESPKENK